MKKVQHTNGERTRAGSLAATPACTCTEQELRAHLDAAEARVTQLADMLSEVLDAFADLDEVAEDMSVLELAFRKIADDHDENCENAVMFFLRVEKKIADIDRERSKMHARLRDDAWWMARHQSKLRAKMLAEGS